MRKTCFYSLSSILLDARRGLILIFVGQFADHMAHPRSQDTVPAYCSDSCLSRELPCIGSTLCTQALASATSRGQSTTPGCFATKRLSARSTTGTRGIIFLEVESSLHHSGLHSTSNNPGSPDARVCNRISFSTASNTFMAR